MEERIRVLRSRARRLVAVHGLSWVVAVVVGVVILLGSADYVIRLRDPGLRVIWSLMALGATAATTYRYLYGPLRGRLSEVDLARRLERRFPGLEDRLVSSVEFMRQPEDDPLAGSGALRRAVIAETAARTQEIDFLEILDRRPSLRAGAVAAAICLVALVLAVLAPSASATAVRRLVYPFGGAWPQRTHLEVRPRIEQAARGRPLEIRVVDARGARLPREVQILCRFEESDGNLAETVETMRPAGDAMVAVLEPVRPFSFRAEGGDDDSMPWQPVDVVEPPGLESVEVKLIPPEYTGWPAQIVKDGRIRALERTRIQISGKANRPLQSAVLRWADGSFVEAGPSDPEGQTVGAVLVLPRATVDEEPVATTLELTDREGLSGERVWEITVVGDRPPTASITRPTDTVYVTAEGVVPIEVAVADDLALGTVELSFGRPAESDDDAASQWSGTSLYRGPVSVGRRAAGGPPQGSEPADRRTIDYSWDLAELDLAAGTELTFFVAASDYRPQTGQSEPHRLIVITPEQLQQRLADRQAQIVAEMGRVLSMQRASRAQVQSLEIRLAASGRLEQLDVDRLQGAELNQRDVATGLTSRSAGVPMHVLALLADLDNNRLDSPELRRRMDSLMAQIEGLRQEHLAVVGRELTAAIKSAQVQLKKPEGDPDGSSEQNGPVATALGEAGRHQDQVVAALEGMLDDLAEWDRYRRFHREISQLLQDQVALADRTAEVGRRTLGKEAKDLLPQESADLTILATQQLELARQFDRIQEQMDRTAEELRPDDPLVAETLADALAEARRLGISPQMLTAGAALRENQTGQATARQRQIAEDLQGVLDVLANRREHELVRLMKKLDEAEADLDDLARREAELRQRIEANARAADAARRRELQQLADEQARLQKESEQLARRLKRLMAEQAGQTTDRAAAAMGRAGEAAARGDGQAAAQAAADAEKALDQARQEVADRRRQARAELAVEQLARLEDNVKHLRRRQQALLDETRRLDRIQARGGLSRAQAASLRELAGHQGTLQREVADLGDNLLGAGAFQWTLTRAAESMGAAAALLARQQTGQPAQDAEQEALGRMDLLIEALKKDPAEQSSSSGGGGAGQGGQPAALQMLAELKLVKLLQEEVNAQTADLQRAIEAGETLTDQQRRRYARLSEDQGRLADLVTALIEVGRSAAAEVPDDLPEPEPKPDGDQGESPIPEEQTR